MENKLQKMLADIQEIVDVSKKQRVEKLERGEYFNVFDILGLTTNETRTHSAYIAELLDPHGSHGCGYKFLASFLKLFPNLSFTEQELESAQIFVELAVGFKNADATEGGRIDIAIKLGHTLVIVENKIYAGDQENQLLRYDNYAQAQREKKLIQQYQLVYLTLDGHQASEFSTAGKLKDGKDYTIVSYDHHIKNWLTECVAIAANKPLVTCTIIQYINLINELTEQNMDKSEQDRLYAIMAEYPDVAEAIYHNGFSAFVKYLFENFCQPQLKTELSKRGLEFSRDNHLSGDKVNGFSIYRPEWKYSRIYINSETYDHDYFIGISYSDIDVKKWMEVTPGFTFFKKEQCEGWPFGWEYLRKYKDFNFSSIIGPLKDGRFVNLIIEYVDNILSMLDEKGISLT